MTTFTKQHPCITEALDLIEDIPDGIERDAKRLIIAEALVHSDEDEARRHLPLIQGFWHRYRLLIELYAAYGHERDAVEASRIIKLMQASEETDGRDEHEQLAEVARKLKDGWRSKPQAAILDAASRDRLLKRSKERLKEMKDFGGPQIALFNEHCLRVACGELDSVPQAMKLAEEDRELRDRITLAIGKGYAAMGKIVSAKEHLNKIVYPEHRIELFGRDLPDRARDELRGYHQGHPLRRRSFCRRGS